MRLKIPLTGTVTGFDPECYKLDGIGISGDDKDPVRPVNINLSGVAWHLISIDLENDLMEVEVQAPEVVDVLILDAEGKPVLNEDGSSKVTKKTLTAGEKQQVLADAQSIIESRTKDELYTLTRDKRLVKPASVMEKYNKAKSGEKPT